jgi:hypothetical protein
MMMTITAVPSISRGTMLETTTVKRSTWTTTSRRGPKNTGMCDLLSTSRLTGQIRINRNTGEPTNMLAITGTMPRIRQPTMCGRVSVQGIGDANTAHGMIAEVM